MTNTSKTIIYFGTDNFSACILEDLIKKSVAPIDYVVTKPDNKSGRGQMLQSSSVKKIAEKYNIKIIYQLDELTNLDLSSTIGVLASYGKLIPGRILDSFRNGIINIHPSLLPKYRGPSPIETSLLNSDTVTGVTIMKLVSKMDAGPIYLSQKYIIQNDDNVISLREKLASIGAKMIEDNFRQISEGLIIPTLQDESKATYCKMIKKSDGLIDPNELTAKEANQRVKAYLLFPKTKLTINNKTVIVTKSHVVSKSSDAPTTVVFKNNTFLSIDNLIAPSGTKMDGKSFANGYLRQE